MAIEIKVPRLGWNMEEGTFLGWLKRAGEAVRAGEPLFTLEGDKSVQEVEATDDGVLHIAPGGPGEGETVLVGAVLGFIAAAGEEIEPAAAAPVVSPAAEKPPAERRVESHTPPSGDRPAITPRARRAAARLGVDGAAVAGTGRNGRVRERDVLARAGAAAEKKEQPALRGTRRVIAERMLHSLRSTAPVTLTTTADATNLVSLRQQFRAASGAAEAIVPTFTDFLVKLTTIALQAHPALNARWEDDRVVPSAEVHMGVAVDTDSGLLVPVIRHVEGLTVRQVARQSKELLDRARAQRLTADEMQGGTFTLSNLGAFGIDAFTPIINWPQCAILGVGRIHRQAAVVDGQVVPRDEVTLSLTFDHRLVDGAPAARFLQTLTAGVESPAAWLVG